MPGLNTFTCSMILSGLTNRKITVHECLDWISLTAFKIKGNGEEFGNNI